MLTTLISVLIALGAFQFSDSFDYPDGADGAPAWFTESIAWQVHGGALEFSGGRRSMARLDKAPMGNEVSVEATVSVQEHTGTDWGVAGVAIRLDEKNYWHMALVEAPPGDNRRHQAELVEMLNGTWLAQSSGDSALKSLASEGAGFDWQYNTPYRLRIAMTPDRIDGWVFESDGTQRVHAAFALGDSAVRGGQPALDCGDSHARFDDVSAKVDGTPPRLSEAEPPSPYKAQGHPALKAEATGFFRTQTIDGRSWFIDPNGAAFYVVGTDHPSYTVHWCQRLGYAPYARNVKAKYGSEAKWAEATMGRLLDWHFNALTWGHSLELRRMRTLPYTSALSLGTSFAQVDALCPQTTWTGFPDVFSDQWARHCDKEARMKCVPLKTDPWLIGYFLDNELEWFGKSYQPTGLFEEAWKKPADHPAKKAWIAFLKKEIGGAEKLREHWDTKFTDYDALAASTRPGSTRSERAEAVARDWVRLVAERYFATCEEAVRRYDPNHLILGCRFAGDAPDVWDIAGKHCDVVSFNMYPRIEVDGGVPVAVRAKIDGWARSAAKPMMITEWSFPALDTDRPSLHGAGMRVDTQAQRAACFTGFQTYLFSLPYMAGSDYFMYADEPALGISESFPEDGNYGLVNEKDEPYSDITEAARALNARVYELHTAATPPDPPAERKLVSWLATLPEREPPLPQVPLTVDSGALRLEGPSEGRAWTLSRQGVALGSFVPLIHEFAPKSDWVYANAVRISAIHENDRVTVVHMVASYKPREQGGARAYNSGWRFWIPRDGGWFASQCVWVENADSAAWRVGEVYHCAMPSLKGDATDDVPLLGEIPNYYLHGAAWVDKAAGIGLGCWYPDGSGFDCNYWKDQQGGFHPDLREPVDAILQPGQRHELKGVMAFFFPLTDVTREGFAKTLSDIRKAATGKP